ncbi:MAG: 4-alpha-glucanotransferase, partial [Proteobacteria bacterium]
MSARDAAPSRAVADALATLGIRRLALAIHDASLPASAGEDVGRGAPASDAAGRFFAFVRGLGFDALQLGPQGETGPANPSPYDATWFSRAVASLAWAPLVRGDHGPRLLDDDTLARHAEAERGADPARARHRA